MSGMRSALLSAFLFLVACGGQTTAEPTDGSTDGTTDAGSDVAVDTGTDTGVDYFSCVAAGDCVLGFNTCCGPCGIPKLTDYTAVNKAKAEAWAKKACATPIPCPDCVVWDERSLMAFCTAGKCTAVDVRTDPVSECATDADCVLRTAECCECGGDVAHPIAIARKSLSAYAGKVCPPDTGCTECAPVYPSTFRPACDATKHCVAQAVK